MQNSQTRRNPPADIQDRSPQDAAHALGGMQPQEIHAALEGVSGEEALQIASHLPGTVSADEANAVAATANVGGTVEDLVVPAPAVLDGQRTAAQTVAYLVDNESITDITYIFVVDDDTLVGVVGMRDIVLAKPGQRLAEIMLTEPLTFRAETSMRDAARTALAQHQPVYPVVDASQRLVGVVHGRELFQRVVVDISGQAGAQVGVSREEQVSTGLFDAFRMRHPWLQVNLMTAFAAALVVGMFEDTITRIVALAAFLPVLAGQSGNTGCQALAITLRGLTLGQLADYPVRRLLRKEILLGGLNGLFVGVVAGGAMWIYAAMSGEAHPMVLGLVILIAMLGACIGSGIFGVLVPLTLKRFGADPAMASSIFLTTFTDILGMGLMLLLATTLLL